MILFNGNLHEDSNLPHLLERLETACLQTLSQPPIDAETVIAACQQLVDKLKAGEYDRVLRPFLQTFSIDPQQFEAAADLFTRESLSYKLSIELGDTRELPPLRHKGHGSIRRRRLPLGILFHIAAGNVDGLPAYSVVEGLLAGNINILKLPSMDHGASLLLLKELTDLEPRLRPYIYVFDVPSTDLASLELFARIADGIVVWGGDEAVSAARQMAAPNTKIISWGHKLSFSYLSGEIPNEELEKLAEHICSTRQLLCSSCQGIFVDSSDMNGVFSVAQRFFDRLRQVNARYPAADPGLRAKATLHLYNEELEGHQTGKKVLRGGGVSVTVCPDSTLELSLLAGNLWVKPLPRAEIITCLKPMKGYLQTAGLLCPPQLRGELGDLLARAGVVRVTEAGEMSRTIPGEAHDGTYPLREYTRIVETV